VVEGGHTIVDVTFCMDDVLFCMDEVSDAFKVTDAALIPNTGMAFHAPTNHDACASASKTRMAVASLGPLRDVKRAARMVSPPITLLMSVRGLRFHCPSQLIGPKRTVDPNVRRTSRERAGGRRLMPAA
jgi:hypothetical protein